MTRNRTTIKVSSRRLLELLAGRITRHQFLRDQDFLTENPFEDALSSGQLAVALEVTKEDDDDWLVFEMGGSDAAIARFVASQKKD